MVDSERQAPGGIDEAIRVYKSILSAVIDQRPSGTRQRLADALGKHRSFVTQITSPAYADADPGASIFRRSSPSATSAQPERRRSSWPPIARAHPGKAPADLGTRRTRHISFSVPDLGDDKQNAALDKAINEFIHRITSIANKGGG